MALPPLKTVLVAMYVPPNLTTSQHNEVIGFIVSEADNAMASINDCKLILAGNLNQLPTNDLKSTLGIEQLVESPTRGKSSLDKLLVDSRLQSHYHSPRVCAFWVMRVLRGLDGVAKAC